MSNQMAAPGRIVGTQNVWKLEDWKYMREVVSRNYRVWCSTARRRLRRAEFAICEQILNFLLTNCELKLYIHFPIMHNYTVEVNKYS